MKKECVTLVSTLLEARKNMRSLKVFELFSGIGSQAKALKNANINYTIVGTSEIDKDAIKGYTAIHGDVTNFGDITKIDAKSIPSIDLLTYSFPCQDLSTAGKGKGMGHGTKTRSSLLWEVKKLVEEKTPPYLLMENVKNVAFKTNIREYLKWKMFLESQGYTNYDKVLNSKDFGAAQSRERMFMISIHNSVGKAFDWNWEPIPNKTFKDVREHNPVGNYTISPKMFEYVKKGRIPKITDNDTTKTLTTKMVRYNNGGVVKDDNYPNGYRYITPKEATLLMGFSEDDYNNLVNAGLSKSAIYKVMGNSIVVNILERIFIKLFPEYIKI